MKLKNILISAITILTIFGLAIFLVVELLKSVEITEFPEKILPPEETHGLASGKQVYEIITDKSRDPQIIEVGVDPLDVRMGEIQLLTVKVKTKATSVTEEDSVLGTVITDNKSTDFPFKLKKAEGEEELITTWQGEWKREDTIKKNYQVRILAKNANGEDQVTLTFK